MACLVFLKDRLSLLSPQLFAITRFLHLQSSRVRNLSSTKAFRREHEGDPAENFLQQSRKNLLRWMIYWSRTCCCITLTKVAPFVALYSFLPLFIRHSPRIPSFTDSMPSCPTLLASSESFLLGMYDHDIFVSVLVVPSCVLWLLLLMPSAQNTTSHLPLLLITYCYSLCGPDTVSLPIYHS